MDFLETMTCNWGGCISKKMLNKPAEKKMNIKTSQDNLRETFYKWTGKS